MDDRIGERFQIETKYTPESLPGGSLDWSTKPETYKAYPAAVKFELPEPQKPIFNNFLELLLNRKSIREFSPRPMKLHQLSYLLWASTGLQREENGHQFRTVPSAGALYPVETYVAANKVENLPAGIYHYAIREHSLEEIISGFPGFKLQEAAMGQDMCCSAQAVFIWTAFFPRTTWKYHQRAYRYVYADAGHMAQNLALAAVSIKIGTCQIGAFFDDKVNAILEVDGVDESVIYMSTAGVV
ncbi:MAG: SagB/ThcOx family dehydrogenase [Candidatus Xenobiia bacterium LiM19]